MAHKLLTPDFLLKNTAKKSLYKYCTSIVLGVVHYKMEHVQWRLDCLETNFEEVLNWLEACRFIIAVFIYCQRDGKNEQRETIL